MLTYMLGSPAGADWSAAQPQSPAKARAASPHTGPSRPFIAGKPPNDPIILLQKHGRTMFRRDPLDLLGLCQPSVNLKTTVHRYVLFASAPPRWRTRLPFPRGNSYHRRPRKAPSSMK